jgi:hypothetical protein
VKSVILTYRIRLALMLQNLLQQGACIGNLSICHPRQQ